MATDSMAAMAPVRNSRRGVVPRRSGVEASVTARIATRMKATDTTDSQRLP